MRITLSSTRFAAFLLVHLLASPAAALDRITINTTSDPPLANQEQSGFHDLLAIEAFGRIGLEAEVVWLPGERSLLNLNQGIDDATLVRIAGLEHKYPNLRRVPEAIMHWDFVAFARNVDFVTDNWSSLKPYNVGFINGWKILETNVREAQSVTKVRDSAQLFGLLVNDRADVVIYERWEGLYLLQTEGLDGVKALHPPLASPEMYMYVHKKHEALIPKLTAALKEMKQDGSYQDIYDRTLRPLLSD